MDQSSYRKHVRVANPTGLSLPLQHRLSWLERVLEEAVANPNGLSLPLQPTGSIAIRTCLCTLSQTLPGSPCLSNERIVTEFGLADEMPQPLPGSPSLFAHRGSPSRELRKDSASGSQSLPGSSSLFAATNKH